MQVRISISIILLSCSRQTFMVYLVGLAIIGNHLKRLSVFSVLSHRDRGCGRGRGGWGCKGGGADGVSTGLQLCQGTWRSQSAPTLTVALGHCFSPRISDSFYNSSALMPLGLVISKLKGKRPFKLGIIKNET